MPGDCWRSKNPYRNGGTGIPPTLPGSEDPAFQDELRHHYEVEDAEALHRILGQQYHAVVGNPKSHVFVLPDGFSLVCDNAMRVGQALDAVPLRKGPERLAGRR